MEEKKPITIGAGITVGLLISLGLWGILLGGLYWVLSR